jgi:hypothetical protein
MSAKRYCPACRHANDADMERCAECGTHLKTRDAGVEQYGSQQTKHWSGPGIPSTCSRAACSRPPAYSPNTRGGGPWYCWPCWRGMSGESAAPVGMTKIGYESLLEIRGLLPARAVEREPGQEG